MPDFDVTAPDGKQYRVTAPEGATQQQIFAYVKKNMASPQPAEGQAPAPGSVAEQFSKQAEQSDERASTFRKAAVRPVVDLFEGTVQHATNLLSRLGLVNENTAAAVQKVRTEDAEQFAANAEKGRKDYPVTAGLGDVAGQLLIYSATSPAFLETKLGTAFLGLSKVLGRVIAAGEQGAVLEGLRADKSSDVGTQAFFGALGAAGGQGVGEAVGAGIAKVANSVGIGRITRQIKAAADGWKDDNLTLSAGLQMVRDRILQQRQVLKAAASAAVTASAGVVPGGRISAAAARAVKAAKDFEDDTKYIDEDLFRSADRAVQTTSLKNTPYSVNQKVLKVASGDDGPAAKTLWDNMSPRLRNLTQKGIFYSALEDATVKDTTKIDPEKLKDALDTPGVKQFFKKPKDSKMIDGFINLVGEASDIVGHHPYLLAHGISGLAGAVVGYEKGGVEGALTGLVAYSMGVMMVNRLLGSQAGRNLLAASAGLSPGTPMAGKAFTQAVRMIGAPLGALPFELKHRETPAEVQRRLQTQD